MGTRSLTKVYDEDGKLLVNCYKQFDGYPSGLGMELSNFLSGRKVVNGYALSDDKEKMSNGMGCLTASLVAHFKDGIGGFYIQRPNATQCWQEYEYHIYYDKIVVKSCGTKKKVIFSGAWNDLESFCVNYKE